MSDEFQDAVRFAERWKQTWGTHPMRDWYGKRLELNDPEGGRVYEVVVPALTIHRETPDGFTRDQTRHTVFIEISCAPLTRVHPEPCDQSFRDFHRRAVEHNPGVHDPGAVAAVATVAWGCLGNGQVLPNPEPGHRASRVKYRLEKEMLTLTVYRVWWEHHEHGKPPGILEGRVTYTPAVSAGILEVMSGGEPLTEHPFTVNQVHRTDSERVVLAALAGWAPDGCWTPVTATQL